MPIVLDEYKPVTDQCFSISFTNLMIYVLLSRELKHFPSEEKESSKENSVSGNSTNYSWDVLLSLDIHLLRFSLLEYSFSLA